MGIRQLKYGVGRVIEEKYNLKHSNNLRLKSGPFTEVVKLQRGSELGV